MVSIPRVDVNELDWEKLGRALIEYGGVPLAIFMAIGITVNILRGYGFYNAFLDPLQNYHLYFVVNVWVVAGIHFYRQRYQSTLLLNGKTELLVAAVAAFTWVASQPLYLLAGYAFYMLAILRKDTLQGSFLPDMDDVSDNTAEDDEDDAWGHLESVKENMT